ncbi:ATP-binding protein [Cupriavidus respiraculi]|uniref:histidine kinase n=1 Tax=Cupriavidus respiraculi TaxID=195930 RepID=A0ABN7YUZ0_9BURK|nr:ATP-binding protein [Cupriavidus respiraculi]CAG9176684.1 Adaptive-response sensory-kinase SasA [Cupriavidus respiraculi]
MSGAAAGPSRLNAWHGLLALWRAPDPPEFHWRLLRYFSWTRVAVALVLALHAWLPPVGLPAEGARAARLAVAAGPAAWPYLAVALAMVAGTLWWRRRFHLRVRAQVVVDLILLGWIYHAIDRQGDALAMTFLVPVLEAGALAGLSFALFAAAVSALAVLAHPFTHTLLQGQADAGLLGAGLYGLVFMIAATLMHLLANRQIAQERLALAREQELRLQQLVNRLMVNDMQDGVMLLRANGQVVAANPAALVLLGVQPTERGKAEGVLADLRGIARLQPLMAMLRDWLRNKDRGNDDTPRVLQLLPLPSRPSSGGGLLHTRLRLRFVLPGLASLQATHAPTLSQGMATGAWNDLSPEDAAHLRLAIARTEAMAWQPEDEALLRSEMRDTVLVHIESWERIAEQVQQEKLAAMGRLVASVAHQIRNPLAAISQASELLSDSGRKRAPAITPITTTTAMAAMPALDPAGALAKGEAAEDDDVDARLLRIIHDNVRRLDQVVSDVLQMSRRPRTEHRSVRLDAALPAILERWRLEVRARAAAAPESGGRPAEANPNAIRLAVDVAQPVIFDPSQLQQVLGNLLDNAWRYCSRRPASIRLLAHALDQHHAELIVWNDGAEISREAQRSLFEPFFTSDAQGTGLGLFMARELCGANDAQVRYGPIALEALLARTGMLLGAARDTLPAKAFVLTLRIDTPDAAGA